MDSDQQKASSSKENNTEGRKSLFAQQFAASGGDTFGVQEKKINNLQISTERSEAVIQMASNTTALFSRSSIISGGGLLGCEGDKILSNRAIEEIQNENLAKLDSMTQDEILEEQARIKSSLGKHVQLCAL